MNEKISLEKGVNQLAEDALSSEILKRKDELKDEIVEEISPETVYFYAGRNGRTNFVYCDKEKNIRLMEWKKICDIDIDDKDNYENFKDILDKKGIGIGHSGKLIDYLDASEII